MNNFNKNIKLQDKISKLFLFIAIYTFLFILFFSTIKYTLPFLLAGLFSLILRKPMRIFINKLGCKPWLASLILSIVFFLLLSSLLVILILSLSNEIFSLLKSIKTFLAHNSSYNLSSFSNLLTNLLSNLNFPDLYVFNTLSSSIFDTLNKLVQLGLSNFSSMIASVFSIFIYIPYAGICIIFTLLSTYLINIKLYTLNHTKLINNPSNNLLKFLSTLKYIQRMITSYTLNFIFLIFMSSSITFLGFTIFNIDFALLLSILCAIFDVLPVIGVAFIYIPLVIYFFVIGNSFTALGLILLYLLVFISRQLLEPKLMSSLLGISPLYTLIAMFIGLQLGGFIGIVFCMFLVIFYKILNDIKFT